jgi:hypothetical protein
MSRVTRRVHGAFAEMRDSHALSLLGGLGRFVWIESGMESSTFQGEDEQSPMADQLLKTSEVKLSMNYRS